MSAQSSSLGAGSPPPDGGTQNAAPENAGTHDAERPKTGAESERTERFGSSREPPRDREIVRTQNTLERYALLEPIGAGGMGEVFRAYDPLLRREVAIKVTRESGGDDVGAQAMRARLVEEARALARLNHPHVIAVFDAGAVGREVFIVMDLVVGRTLRTWLSVSPPIDAVLEHMIAAGEGLAAAHEVGIVHRDFKPENVMIAADGRARVLDFGISQLFTPGEAPGLGASGPVSGTPRYMAPEQWRGGDLDARSDQFSFCITLFEVLSGAHPFAETPREALEARSASGMPPLPSGLPSAAQRALLAVSRGFSADPAARFPSMEALLAALRGARRRRAPVRALAAVGGAVALAGAIWAGVLGATHLREGRCAGIQEDLWSEFGPTLAERHTRLGLSSAMFDRLQARVRDDTEAIVHAERESCLDTHVRGRASEEAMDRRSRCIDKHKRGLSALLGALTRAQESSVLVQALDAIDGLPSLGVCADPDTWAEGTPLPDDPQKRARVLGLQARLDALVGRSAVDKDAAPLIEEAGALVAAATAEHHAPLIAQAHAAKARVARAAGKLPEAAREIEAAATFASQSRDDALLAVIWVLASDVASDQSKYERALAFGDVARASIARAGGDAALESRLDKALGWALRELGRLDEAEARYRAIIARSGEDEAGLRARAGAYSGLGVLEKERGRYEEAAANYQRALALHEQSSGPDHPVVATVLTNLGVTRKQQGRREEARALYERALAIYDRSVSKDDPARGITLANLGTLLSDAGKPAEARSYYVEAQRLWAAAYGPTQLRVLFVNADIAKTYIQEGRLEDAEPLFRKALEGLVATLGPDTWNTALVRADLAALLAKRRKLDEAVVEARQAIQVAEAQAKEPRMLAQIAVGVADALWSDPARHGEARSVIQRIRARVAKDKQATDTLEDWLRHRGTI